MPDARETFEQQIREAPDDIERWTVYADYLLAQGDRRGELIMLECTAEGSSPALPSGELQAKIKSLRSELENIWAELSEDDWDHVPDVEFGYRRGCIWSARVSNLGDAPAAPLRRLLSGPHARLLCELELVFEPAPASAAIVELAEQLDLSRLLTLRCRYHTLAKLFVRALARHDTLALETLDLRHAGLDDDDMRTLARVGALQSLRTLYLQHNQIGAKGMRALVYAPWMAGLEQLDLRYNPIGPQGARHLASSPHVGKLRTLWLHAPNLEHDGIFALAHSRTLAPDLVRLWRGQLQIEQPGANT